MKTLKSLRKRISVTIAAVALATAATAETPTPVARGAQAPIVIELFTSQGCSSCPPADQLLAQYADRADVIALSMNVDYWDYLGWPDTLARPEHTARQTAYRGSLGNTSIYTPQMVIHGRTDEVGHHRQKIDRAIEMTRELDTAPIVPAIAMSGPSLTVALPETKLAKPVDVIAFPFVREVSVAIGNGENEGRRITYTNVSLGPIALGSWDGTAATRTIALETLDRAATGVAVIIQDARTGPIRGAAKFALDPSVRQTALQ